MCCNSIFVFTRKNDIYNLKRRFYCMLFCHSDLVFGQCQWHVCAGRVFQVRHSNVVLCQYLIFLLPWLMVAAKPEQWTCLLSKKGVIL